MIAWIALALGFWTGCIVAALVVRYLESRADRGREP